MAGNENQLKELKLRRAADLAIFEQEKMNSLFKGYGQSFLFLKMG
jgi:hypothetical protein